MSLSSKSLTITGYKFPTFTYFGKIGSYQLQLNPSELSVGVGQKEGKKSEDTDAVGNAISSKAPIFLQRTLDLSFTIDNTGAVPNAPDGMGFFSGSLADSIQSLEMLTVEPVASTHRPPFVRISWGLGDISFYGIVTTFKYNYTFFDSYGIPLRAVVTMQVQDFDSSDGASLLQSPDITKMPVIKEGDTIVKLSEEYYDNKKYYIKLAEFNNLSSLRNLKHGTHLEIPPIR
jgi:hypothetical protein